MLNVLAETHRLPDSPELRLHSAPWRNSSSIVALAQKIPAEEAREVLERAEDLVATDGGGDEAEVMGGKGVGGNGDEGSDSGHFCGFCLGRGG